MSNLVTSFFYLLHHMRLCTAPYRFQIRCRLKGNALISYYLLSVPTFMLIIKKKHKRSSIKGNGTIQMKEDAPDSTISNSLFSSVTHNERESILFIYISFIY